MLTPLQNYIIRLTLGFGIVALSTMYFADRFRISVPTAENSCLEAQFYLIDTYDKSVSKGELMAFGFPSDTDSWYKKGTKFIKIVGGVGGDTVSVTEKSFTINEQVYDLPLSYALGRLKMPVSSIEKTIVVPENHFYGIGETIKSYDSRFWGTIPQQNIIGQAYAIY